MSKGGLQGYLIDKKTADKLNIKSVMDIKKHAKQFDSNGDGKADMVACPPGWGCEKQITKHFAELGLGDFINPVQADYSASMADAIAKYKNGKSVLFYTWTPNWTVGALELGKDIVWIEVPYSETKKVKVANATKSKINMGFGADDIRAAANVDFLKANPKVEKMLKKASIPLADVAAQNMKMNAGEKSERAIKKHANAWIKNNQSTFDSWLKIDWLIRIVSLKFAPSDYEIYIPIAEWIEKNIKEWLFMQRPLFKKLSAPIDTVLDGLDTLFNIIPFPLAILIFLYFAYKTNGFKFAILTMFRFNFY